MMDTATYGAAFLGGLFSFFSPCLLPMIPIYICYISGVRLADLQAGNPDQTRIFLNALCFVLGFTLIFMSMGWLIGILGTNFVAFKIWFMKFSGILIILFGLYIMQLIRLPFLDREHRLQLKFHKFGYLPSFLFGAAFSIGWIPCTTPILTSILMLGASSMSAGKSTLLLATYSLGMAIPFMLVGLFTPFFLEYVNHEHRYLRYVYVAAGVLLILIGTLLVTDKLHLFLAMIGDSV
jgi:cytochrome c-type biogenesis protein